MELKALGIAAGFSLVLACAARAAAAETAPNEAPAPAAIEVPLEPFGPVTESTRRAPMPLSERAFYVFANNCFECHGGHRQESKLDLRRREGFLNGGERGPAIEPGDPEASTLYFFVSHRTRPNMPPKPKQKLGADDLQTIEEWIRARAPWPENIEALLAADEEKRKLAEIQGKAITDEDRNWWAFRPPALRVPEVADANNASIKNDVDRFIAAGLREKGIEPAPRATKWELIRRATLDLTGLPPTPSETLAFVFDSSPDAFAKVVDRLLASPHYGERWGRHWLDVARYSDSNGYEFDYHRPEAWRYRDYVVAAFNSDKPFDRFIIEQLAGDELPDRTTETLIASGFNRMGPTVDNQESEEARMNELDDMVSTTASGLLGLTVGCARCHDHKFDPIRQIDYYRLQAIFYQTKNDMLPLVPEEEAQANREAREANDREARPLTRAIEAIENPYREKMRRRVIEEKFPETIRIAFDTAEDQRTEGQKLIVAQTNRTIDAHYKYEELRETFSAEHAEAIDMLKNIRGRIEARKPGFFPVAMGLRDSSASPAPARFLFRGSHANKGPEVAPGVPGVIESEGAYQPEASEKSTGRRLALAKWIASPENPLTARVMANRIWQHHFGRGIVGTPSDYGHQGEAPTHPELLDYLAIKFAESGWSVKAMHRLIMNSAAYQMSSANDPAKAALDGDNRLFWRQNPRRLEAEPLRDALLAASGRLNLRMGGPAFIPPLTDEMKISIGANLEIKPSEDPNELLRRSIYMYQKRNLPAPLLEVLDLPDSNQTCSRRDRTTVPTQALTLFNNEITIESARALAKALVAERGENPEALADAASWRIFSRPSTAAERETAAAFLKREGAPIEDALADYCRVLFNTNEFVYLR